MPSACHSFLKAPHPQTSPIWIGRDLIKMIMALWTEKYRVYPFRQTGDKHPSLNLTNTYVFQILNKHSISLFGRWWLSTAEREVILWRVFQVNQFDHTNQYDVFVGIWVPFWFWQQGSKWLKRKIPKGDSAAELRIGCALSAWMPSLKSIKMPVIYKGGRKKYGKCG